LRNKHKQLVDHAIELITYDDETYDPEYMSDVKIDEEELFKLVDKSFNRFMYLTGMRDFKYMDNRQLLDVTSYEFATRVMDI
jgi:hypothetical protein